ncbi:MAG: hypothetical protein WCL61_00685 [bacterium]
MPKTQCVAKTKFRRAFRITNFLAVNGYQLDAKSINDAHTLRRVSLLVDCATNEPNGHLTKVVISRLESSGVRVRKRFKKKKTPNNSMSRFTARQIFLMFCPNGCELHSGCC